MRFRSALLTIAWLVAGALTIHAQVHVPTPVVERISTHFGRTTRVSLFSNHVVIVAVRSETEDFVHKATLSFDEYMVYLQAMDQAARKINDQAITSDVESRDSVTELTLHVGPKAPFTLKYSPLASLNLEAGKIASIVDDIQNRALSALPGEFEIKQWKPAVGDRVALRQGGEAFVAAVDEHGTVVLVQPDSSISTTVIMENRATIILEVVEHAE